MTVTKKLAAQSQLETAIWLWFKRDDPISTCALAYAAQDCYAALRNRGSPPKVYSDWFKNQSKGFQKRVREVLAYFKHGPNKLTGKVRLPPLLGEMLILDSIDCHENVYEATTHLMEIFRIRFCLENPSITPLPFKSVFSEQEALSLLEFGRTDYFEKFHERSPLSGSSLSGLHIGKS